MSKKRRKTKVIGVFNYKGGSGKSTISTNIAGFLANAGYVTWFGDFDLQKSSHNWLSKRSAYSKKILPWSIKNGRLEEPGDDVDYIVIDSAGSISSEFLLTLVSLCDKVIVPVAPGPFDIDSSATFLKEIVQVINNQEKATEIALVGNMVIPDTDPERELKKFLEKTGLPVVTYIKRSNTYVDLAGHGLTLFDGKKNNEFFLEEKADWKPLVEWLTDSDEETNDE